MSRLLSVIALGFALTLASVSHAQNDPDGSERLDAALVLFDASDFANAAIIFESVYNDTRRGDALFGWAQSLRLAGDCKRAIPLYERYLAEARPEPHQIGATHEAIALCPEAEPSETDQPIEPPPESVAEQLPPPGVDDGGELPAGADLGAGGVPRSGERQRGRDWLTVGLGSVAIGSLVSAGLFYAFARTAAADADGATSYEEYLRLADTAESRQRVAVIAGGVGLAAVVGVVAWRLLQPGDSGSEPALSVSPSLSRPGAVVSFHF